MNSNPAIKVTNLSKSLDSCQVIKDCSMNVAAGMIYGFLGPNGAGKTTVFKLLTGLLEPDSGSIRISGAEMPGIRDQLLSQIGSLIEIPVFYEHLSARENLEIHLAYMGSPGIGVDKALLMTGLSGANTKPVSTYSLGMRQRLGIARALVHGPRILILDEPVNGLDPMGIREMRDLFLKLSREHGMTIVLSSHILSEVEHIADKIGIIADGRILCECDLEQIKKDCQGSLEDYFFALMSGGEK